jgi:hypothetical protein
MQLNRARVIVQEVTEWVNYHFKKGPQPANRINYTLFEISKAAETVKLNNLVLANSKHKGKIMAVPKDEMIAGAFLAHALIGMEEGSRLEIASNGVNRVVVYGPEKKQVIVSSNQLRLDDAIKAATSGQGLVIVRG